jgi:superfamily II DNA or RNA helicase
MIQLYEHQRKSIDEINNAFLTHRKVLYQLSTGGGKTVVMSSFVQDFKGKILVLVHRSELVEQTVKTFANFGINAMPLTAKNKEIPKCNVIVAMVETLNNRLKRENLEIDLIIADECHRMDFNKIIDLYDCKVLGLTATPVLLQKHKYFKCKVCNTIDDLVFDCHNEEAEEWSRDITMSEFYDTIVVGRSISELIQDSKLVQNIDFVEQYINVNNLKTDNTGEYSTASQNSEYNKPEAVFNVLLNYKKYCLGKKTMIFNSSCENNLKLYESFSNENLNVKMFDSVNESEFTRHEIVEWFKNERDAILLNVGVFTTGFDVTDVEAIIVNRATTSLSLWLQIVGRGARITDKIYKDEFICIDGGGNIERHRSWSAERDWNKIFYNGLRKPRRKKDDAINIKECKNCGVLFDAKVNECPECGFIEPEKPKKPKSESDEVVKIVANVPIPNAEKIINYTKRNNGDLHFAINILIDQIVNLFKYHSVSYELYKANNGKRITQLINGCYHKFYKELNANSNRTIAQIKLRVNQKLEKYYGES